MNRLSRWGVGPSIVLAALSYAAIGAIMTYLWPDTYLIRAIPYPVFLVTGASLLVIGVLYARRGGGRTNPELRPGSTRHEGHLRGREKPDLLGVDRVSVSPDWSSSLGPCRFSLHPWWRISSSRRGSSGKKSIWRSDSGTPTSRTGPRSTNCCPFPGSDDREPAR